MSNFWNDFRHGVRLLLRAPGFTFVAVAALAIGIGANTAIFSVINTLLIQRLPYRDADRLAMVWEHNIPRDRKSNVVAPANFLHWREMNRTFEDLAAVSPTVNVTLTGSGDPEEVQAHLITAELFQVLGVPPALGRGFKPDEIVPNSRVVVISDRLWKRRFQGDPSVLQRVLVSQGTPYSVIGVMPHGFSFLDRNIDVWLPFGFTAATRTPAGRSIQVVGRLKPDVTLAQAQQDMVRVAADLTRMFPAFNTGWSARVESVREQMTGRIRPALFLLAAAVGFVLLIACANVANLLLARSTARQRELAVRAALGAGRARLIRQLLAESLVLAAAGGICGLLLAWWALTFLRAVVAERLAVQRLEAVGIDGWVLAFTLGVSLACGLLSGAVPALTAAGSSLNDQLREGGRTGSGSRGNRTRSGFVVAEISLALVLLAGAGLLIRSFKHLVDVNPGFDASRTVTMRLSLPGSRYGADGQRERFHKRFFEQVDPLPGVEAAGAISWLPLAGLGAATSMQIIGQPKPPTGLEPVTDVRVISHDYLKAMSIPLLKGRLFNENDATDNTHRVVINETMARKFWPGRDPIGQHIKINWDDNEDEIIGIVGDVKHTGLDGEVRSMTYWPYARYVYGTMTLAVRTHGRPEQVVKSIAAIVRAMDPDLVVANVRTMQEVVDNSVAERRLTMLLLTTFAGTALLLAAVGVYGVIAYSVTQRTQEIGIRMALGAQHGDVLRMIVGEALILMAAGIALGLVGAFGLTSFMKDLLFQVRPADPVTFAAGVVTLTIVALVASYVPGRRATRVDPVIALRAE